MKNISEKHFAVGASTFCILYGVATCSFPDFMSGFFAGAATLISYVMWMDPDESV